MLNNGLTPLGDEELGHVTGGSEIVDTGAPVKNSDPLDTGNKLTWCLNCKKMVKYHEFTGGRYVCDICGKFVQA